MRLTPFQREIFKQLTAEVFGPQAQVWLFGSRADDQRRGGDIDLYITGFTQTSKEIQDAVSRFVVKAPTPGEPRLLIHRVAEETGILL